MKSKYSIATLFFILAVFIFVNYQNCSSGGNNLSLPSNGSSSSGACSLSVTDSNGIPQTSFQVGQTANITITTTPPGPAIYLVTYNQVGGPSQSITTPTTLQQSFANATTVGTYSISVQAAQNGKVVCSTTTSFSVVPQGGTNVTTCILTATSGTGGLNVNTVVGQAVPFSITSNPTGLQAFISGDGLGNGTTRVAKGLTNINYTETFSSVGSFARHADVQDSTGAFVSCSNNIAVSVSK